MTQSEATTNFNPIIAPERQQDIYGISGRYTGATMRLDEKPGCFCQQRWLTTREIQYEGQACQIKVTLRFDDDCRNGHNTFSITGEINSHDGRRSDPMIIGGCIHEEIAKYFPRLVQFIRWHLVSSDGPIHYIANARYHAGLCQAYGPQGEMYPANLDHLKSTILWGIIAGETDEALTALIADDRFDSKLKTRLQILMPMFRSDMELCGFLWERVA